MDIRAATASDVESIREVALASLSASYGHAVGGPLLREAVEKWYEASDLSDTITDETTVCPVATVDGDVVGFAESYVVDRRERVGEINWLHVNPEHRNAGIGSKLLQHVERALRDRDVDAIEGTVLADNEAGTAFYEREGYDPAGERTVEIGGEAFDEQQYRKQIEATGGLTAGVYETADGETVHVDFEAGERGSLAPFYATYADAEHADRYGYLCGNCEGTSVAVDTMDAMECLDCPNRRKPMRWDAAY
jgi:ribosomal protein S18 acetylase RimI-like enzyme